MIAAIVSDQISPQQIVETLQAAFRPLSVEAKIEDMGRHISFVIVDENGKPFVKANGHKLGHDNLATGNMTKKALQKLIDTYRRDLKKEGVTLEG